MSFGDGRFSPTVTHEINDRGCDYGDDYGGTQGAQGANNLLWIMSNPIDWLL